MTGLQSGEGRIMINLVIWAQLQQRDRHTDSHVAIANDVNALSSGLVQQNQIFSTNKCHRQLHKSTVMCCKAFMTSSQEMVGLLH